MYRVPMLPSRLCKRRVAGLSDCTLAVTGAHAAPSQLEDKIESEMRPTRPHSLLSATFFLLPKSNRSKMLVFLPNPVTLRSFVKEANSYTHLVLTWPRQGLFGLRNTPLQTECPGTCSLGLDVRFAPPKTREACAVSGSVAPLIVHPRCEPAELYCRGRPPRSNTIPPFVLLPGQSTYIRLVPDSPAQHATPSTQSPDGLWPLSHKSPNSTATPPDGLGTDALPSSQPQDSLPLPVKLSPPRRAEEHCA